jgi:uncharacterized membrane protein
VVAINPTESANIASSENNISFRWIYIILPAVFLLLSIVLTAFFYHRLPSEVAYHFSGGAPDSWTGRSAIITWMLVPQFLLTLLSFAIVRTAIFGTRYVSAEGTPLKKLLIVMGNMAVLPQLILIFAMLDIFLYNAYQIRLIPLWVFALIVMLLGAVILGIFFIQTIWQVRRLRGKSLRE